MNPQRIRIPKSRLATGLSVWLPVLLLAVLLPGSAAQAAGPDDPWLIGLDLVVNGVGDDEEDDELQIDENGGGAALQVGYLFTPSFLLRLYGSGAVHQTDNPDVDIVFSGGTIEAMYLFRPGEVFRPYVFGGLGGYRAESSQDNFTYSTEGPGMAVGGGMFYFANPQVSFHASLRLEAVNWDKATVSLETPTGTIVAEIPVDDSGSAAKFTVGMGFWF